MASATYWNECANLTVTSAPSNVTQFQLATVAMTLSIAQPRVYCCVTYNTSGLPQWFVDQMVLPYQRLNCQKPIGFQPNATTYIVVDKYTWQPTDVRKICPIAFQQSVYKFLNTHYTLFYGLSIPTISAGVGSGPVGQFQARFLQLAAYCTPLAVAIMIFGLSIIWKVLKKSESTQLFVYHTTLLFVDIFLYVFSVFNSTIGMAVFGWIGCMVSAYFAINLDGFAGLTISVMLVSQYCFANFIQAILAADRACGVLWPVFYRAYASARVAGVAVLVAFLFNSLLTIAEILLIDGLTCALMVSDLANIPTEACDTRISQLKPLVKAENALRFVLFLGAVLVQVVCCTAMLITIRKMKRSAAAGGASVNTVSLTPCYMLLGTCGLNAFGAITETAFLLANQFSPSQRSLSAVVTVAYEFLRVWRFVMLPMCNSCGMWAHCIASRKYREEVILAFSPLTGPIRKFLTGFRAPKVSASVGSADSSSGVASSSSVKQSRSGTMSTTVSHGSHTNSTASVAIPKLKQGKIVY